jgi:hypothetical protein
VSRPSQTRRSPSAGTCPHTLVAGEADDTRSLLLLLLRLLHILVVGPDFGLGCVQAGSGVLGRLRFLALAVGAQHLDLLLCAEFFLDGRLDDVDG